MKKKFILFTTVLVLCFIASSCSKKTGSTITTGEPTATPTITEQQPENTPTPEPTKEVIESTTEHSTNDGGPIKYKYRKRTFKFIR